MWSCCRLTVVLPLCTVLMAACSPGPVAPPESGAPASEAVPSVNTLTTKATTLVDQMAAGQFGAVAATFDAAMTTALPPSGLATVWSQLQQKVGAFKAQTGTRETKEAGYEVVYVTCSFEHANLNAKVVFDKVGKVTGLFFQP